MSIDDDRALQMASMARQAATPFERAKALRSHAFVVAWIDAYQKAVYRNASPPKPDCVHCGFPHGADLICGRGATFGQLKIGPDTYYVDSSNVEYFVALRGRQREGHHWRHEIYFKGTADHVEVTSYWEYNGCPQERVWRIPRTEWAFIVRAMLDWPAMDKTS